MHFSFVLEIVAQNRNSRNRMIGLNASQFHLSVVLELGRKDPSVSDGSPVTEFKFKKE